MYFVKSLYFLLYFSVTNSNAVSEETVITVILVHRPTVSQPQIKNIQKLFCFFSSILATPSSLEMNLTYTLCFEHLFLNLKLFHSKIILPET